MAATACKRWKGMTPQESAARACGLTSRNDFIVCCLCVEALQVFATFLWNYSCFIVRAGQSANVVEGVPEQHGDEFDLVSDVASKQIAASKAGFCAYAG